MQTVMKVTGGTILQLAQCEYGFTSIGDDGVERPAKKSTGMLTNSPAMAVTLERRCKGDHKHTHVIGGGRCRKAQTYPVQLCEAIAQGVILQKK